MGIYQGFNGFLCCFNIQTGSGGYFGGSPLSFPGKSSRIETAVRGTYISQVLVSIIL
jgi:hypothetical protein